MKENEIRALLEGAYAQTPTLPGFFVKYDEFRSRFNKLIEQHSDLPLDIEKNRKTQDLYDRPIVYPRAGDG